MLRLTTLGRLSIDGRAASAQSEVRPRRLALLAILAAAGSKGVSREQVLAILWTDSEPERARHSLSQALYSLRRDLGEEVVLVTPTLRLDSSRITSDVEDFRAAVAEKNWERAAEFFVGPFLDGFYLTDAPQFERWAEEERSALWHDGLRAIESAAKNATSDGRLAESTEYWRRLTRLNAVNGRFATAYMDALVKGGDRTAALTHAQSHADVVRRELEVEPEPEIVRFIEAARVAAAAAAPTPPPPAPAQKPLDSARREYPARPSAPIRLMAPSAGQVPVPARAWRVRPRLRTVAIAALVLIAVLGAVWRSVGARSPGDRSAGRDEASRSPVANRLYNEGLRAFYQSDVEGASRLFNAALKEDSKFALATYFAWRAEVATNGARQSVLADRAVAMAAKAPDRDRLLILTHIGASRFDLRAAANAESLATRYPNDPEALIRAGDMAVDLPRAEALLDRAIVADSSAGRSPTAICRLCDGFATLVHRYSSSDSTKRVEQTLDRWSALRPDDYQPWRLRADYFVGLGRVRDADAALRRADSLGAPHPGPDSMEVTLTRALRLDDFDASNRICQDKLTTQDIDEFTRFRSLCTIGLRMQGRYRDALGLIRGGRVPNSTVVRSGLPLDRVNAAILDMEMGRPATAAIGFAGLAAEAARDSLPEGVKARSVAWYLTLSATASERLTDTLRVRALVDSVELVGNRSLDPRDARLHHFLRGVLLSESGAHEQAVRAFRAALSSPSEGYTRINYEMAKSLLALHRPADATVMLRSALRSGVGGSGLFVTRTELHELAGEAFVAGAQQDSAAFHYAIVERAWRGADSTLAPRYAAARQWLLRSGRSAR